MYSLPKDLSKNEENVLKIIQNTSVVEDLHKDSIIVYIVQSILHLQETIKKMNNQCIFCEFNFLHFPLSGFKRYAKLIHCTHAEFDLPTAVTAVEI